LLEDSRVRPDLFHWNGQMGAAGLYLWLSENPWVGRCPTDLLALWEETGDPQLGDDIAAVNSALRQSGMPERFLVFHRGMITSAADMESGDYVELSPDRFRVLRRFPSLEAWYVTTLREEYAKRYALPE
jgi:hypothetical protein